MIGEQVSRQAIFGRHRHTHRGYRAGFLSSRTHRQISLQSGGHSSPNGAIKPDQSPDLPIPDGRWPRSP